KNFGVEATPHQKKNEKVYIYIYFVIFFIKCIPSKKNVSTHCVKEKKKEILELELFAPSKSIFILFFFLKNEKKFLCECVNSSQDKNKLKRWEKWKKKKEKNEKKNAKILKNEKKFGKEKIKKFKKLQCEKMIKKEKKKKKDKDKKKKREKRDEMKEKNKRRLEKKKKKRKRRTAPTTTTVHSRRYYRNDHIKVGQVKLPNGKAKRLWQHGTFGKIVCHNIGAHKFIRIIFGLANHQRQCRTAIYMLQQIRETPSLWKWCQFYQLRKKIETGGVRAHSRNFAF
ncbi:hypothetical protein RFI_38396, partial [Reticulomyxa filosa]